ncbi:MAG: hypothetical protein HY551_01920 [Elusimicrobia bacterium]|nr:hypothetical protein [Elusimicrobiota bacterium]
MHRNGMKQPPRDRHREGAS